MKQFCLAVLFLGILSACSSEKERNVAYNFVNDVLIPHTSVQNQERTQTCWAYTMVSLFESDLLARTTDTIRLSTMYAVRQKYMRQFEKFYYSKGREEIRGGALGHSFLNVIEEKGIVPYDVYQGCLEGSNRHDHRELLKRLRKLAEDAVSRKNLPLYRQKAEMMLDEYMGKVPESFCYKGKEYTPHSFADSLNLDAEGYIELTSFLHHPFYFWCILEIPDNWEHASFYNVPIDSLESYVHSVLNNGETVAWDGDISEDGFMARYGVAVYPDSIITQQKRQEAFEQYETTDDHMMHIVGLAHDESGKRYYILKNSWGKVGPYKGLIYMSHDYFRAKTVSIVLPKKYIQP